jgi:H+/Cl- antiporter ClcA
MRIFVSRFLLAGVIGLACGISSTLFLIGLEWVSNERNTFPQLIYALPLAGLMLGFTWEKLNFASPGMQLVLGGISGTPIPFRLLPGVLLGTWWSHLFGASVGREGAAVQMGAAVAQLFSRVLKADSGPLILAGVAGGFSSVFGTPLAAIVFAFEFQKTRSLNAVVPVVLSAFIANGVTHFFPVTHMNYPQLESVSLTVSLVLHLAILATACALVALAYTHLTDVISVVGKRIVPKITIRLMLVGVFIAAIQLIPPMPESLGLGLPLIERSFFGQVAPQSFIFKLLLTALCVGSGFIGGEVTSLFVIGSTLGFVLAPMLGLEPQSAVALSMTAMFAAAGKVPLAMALCFGELFSWSQFPQAIFVCSVASFLHFTSGLYKPLALSQKQSD